MRAILVVGLAAATLTGCSAGEYEADAKRPPVALDHLDRNAREQATRDQASEPTNQGRHASGSSDPAIKGPAD